MQGIVYNSFYRSLRDSDTAISNLAHIKYIMCKYKEVTFNKDCDFSLWGKFPGQACGDINDYDFACKTISEVSDRRTIYRGVLSLDGETADYKKMNDRAAWQEMTEKRMHFIAKEYDIKPENFCWAASFHFKEGHPHTHIMFWDNSDDVREEFIPKKRFEVATDKIRESFNKEIFAEELHSLYKEQDDVKTTFKQQFNIVLKTIGASINEKDADAQEQLRLILGEENLFGGQVDNSLATFHLNDDKLYLLTNRLLLVYNSLPDKGSIDYKFLPTQVKAELNAAIDAFLDAVPQYKNQYDALLKSADEISDLYDNRIKGKEHHREGLKYKLYTDLGNQALKWIKANQDNLLNTESRIKALSGIIAIQNTTADVFNKLANDDPVFETIKKQPHSHEDLHLLPSENEKVVILGEDETEPKTTTTNVKINELQKLIDIFPSKYVSSKKMFADDNFSKLFNNAVNEILKTAEVKAIIADYCVSDRVENRQRLLHDFHIILSDDYSDEELEQMASDMLADEKAQQFEQAEKHRILRFCKKNFADLDEEQLAIKVDAIHKNANNEFDKERKDLNIPIKQTDYFEQQADAYKIVRQEVLRELKNLNQWDEQLASNKAAWQQRQEEWQQRQEKYEKEVCVNLAIRLVVNLSRLFKSDNWQRYKNSVLGQDKSLLDRKNIRATLKQKSAFEWRDEFDR